jgi:hypothetical protein
MIMAIGAGANRGPRGHLRGQSRAALYHGGKDENPVGVGSRWADEQEEVYWEEEEEGDQQAECSSLPDPSDLTKGPGGQKKARKLMKKKLAKKAKEAARLEQQQKRAADSVTVEFTTEEGIEYFRSKNGQLTRKDEEFPLVWCKLCSKQDQRKKMASWEVVMSADNDKFMANMEADECLWEWQYLCRSCFAAEHNISEEEAALIAAKNCRSRAQAERAAAFARVREQHREDWQGLSLKEVRILAREKLMSLADALFKFGELRLDMLDKMQVVEGGGTLCPEAAAWDLHHRQLSLPNNLSMEDQMSILDKMASLEQRMRVKPVRCMQYFDRDVAQKVCY